jgi:hypothetical protein
MTDHFTHMHEHQHEENYGCGCGCGCGCGSQHHHHEEGCKCAEKFLEIADEAWKEVLKEKIKAKILTHKGEHMEKLAEIIAKANGEKWKHIISAKTKSNEFKDSLKEFLSSCE